MIVHFSASALKESRWYEYVARFALGGLMTVVTGVVADRWGAAAGGLFLAFPAVFCASATMIEKHERRRKEDKALRGARRGREAAAMDAAGTGWGSLALITFAVVVSSSLGPLGLYAIALAAGVWLAAAVLLWSLRREL